MLSCYLGGFAGYDRDSIPFHIPRSGCKDVRGGKSFARGKICASTGVHLWQDLGIGFSGNEITFTIQNIPANIMPLIGTPRKDSQLSEPFCI